MVKLKFDHRFSTTQSREAMCGGCQEYSGFVFYPLHCPASEVTFVTSMTSSACVKLQACDFVGYYVIYVNLSKMEDITFFMLFLASQDALEVTRVTESLTY